MREMNGDFSIPLSPSDEDQPSSPRSIPLPPEGYKPRPIPLNRRHPQYEDMYEFEEEDVVYIYDLEGQVTRLQQRIMDGAHCELRHAANDGDRIYVSDSPKDFTQPAFVLIDDDY